MKGAAIRFANYLKIQPYRRSFLWALALWYVLVPFWEINGESALRFDVQTLRLYFFGSVLWVQEFFAVMLAILFLVLLFFLTTLLFGRVWCGWFCPQTVLSDLTEPLTKFVRGGLVVNIAKHIGLFLISLLMGFSTVCYLVSPYDLLAQIMTGTLRPVAGGGIIVITIILYLNLVFMRRTFCATICPYAKFQGAITDDKTLAIGMDEQRRNECVHCQRCIKVCPTGLDIRKGMQVGCIMCAACVDACSKTMAAQKKKTLISYHFGRGGDVARFSLARPGVIALFLLAMVPLAMFSYQVFYRSSFDFSILPHSMVPRQTRNGEVLNAYILSIKNMSKADLSLTLTMTEGENSTLRLSIRKPLLIPAELVEKIPLFVRGKVTDKVDREIVLMMRSEKEPERVVSRKVYFVIP